jgi:4'-phosphopantetheinyl transferase
MTESYSESRQTDPASGFLHGWTWPFGPAQPKLGENEVHVWCTGLCLVGRVVASLSSRLSGDEQQRASRYLRQRDQRRFTLARGWLRTILGLYLKCDPRVVEFAYGPRGKPLLADSETGLRFNLAHSEEMAICAVTSNRWVGVDVEAIRPMTELEQIARRFFCRGEVVRLLSLHPVERLQGFFNCWTRKEAYLKATGQGVAAGLDQFEVTLAPGDTPLMLSNRFAPEELQRWTLYDLQPLRGYAAALAVEGSDLSVKSWHWNQTADAPVQIHR